MGVTHGKVPTRSAHVAQALDAAGALALREVPNPADGGTKMPKVNDSVH